MTVSDLRDPQADGETELSRPRQAPWLGLLRSRQAAYRPIIENVVALYGVNLGNYLLPLLTVPYLARVLGAQEWGLLAFAQAFGNYVVLVVDYGFTLSAARHIARYRSNREVLAETLAGVLGAKTLLMALATGAALVLVHWVPLFRDHPNFLWAALFWAIAQSFYPLWYYFGLERMRIAASIDVSSKLIGAIGIFVLIHHPSDAVRVLVLQGIVYLIAAAVALALVYREVRFRWPTIRLASAMLQQGWAIFISKSAAGIFSASNTFILGLFAPVQIVGYFAGADKITRALMGLLSPVSQGLYPRISHLVHSSRSEAGRLVRDGLIVMTGGGLLLGLVLFVFAGPVIHLVLGPGFAPAIPIIRILALLLPVVAANAVLGVQWMLPLGMDRTFTFVTVGAGVLNVSLALLLAPRFQGIGMASAVVVAETALTGAMYAVLRWRGLAPFNSSLLDHESVRPVVT